MGFRNGNVENKLSKRRAQKRAEVRDAEVKNFDE